MVILFLIGASLLTTMSTSAAPTVTATPALFALATSTKVLELVDCGDDLRCFIRLVATECDVAQVEHTRTIDAYGLVATSIMLYQTRGMEADHCLLYVLMLDGKMELEDRTGRWAEAMRLEGKSQEELVAVVEQGNAILRSGIGVSRICAFPLDDLVAMLERWGEGTFSPEDFSDIQCTLPVLGK
jgi:hypothetical protein